MQYNDCVRVVFGQSGAVWAEERRGGVKLGLGGDSLYEISLEPTCCYCCLPPQLTTQYQYVKGAALSYHTV